MNNDNSTLILNDAGGYYWYSIEDVAVLMARIREKYLGNMTMSQYEISTSGIFLSVPLNYDDSNTKLENDFKTIAERIIKADIPGAALPTALIFPTIIGRNHWTVNVVCINYEEKIMYILKDDPFGGKDANKIPDRMIRYIENTGERLIDRHYEKNHMNNDYLVTNMLLTKKKPQQFDGWNCGPIIVSNIKDYINCFKKHENKFKCIESIKYTFNINKIQTIRENDIENYKEIIKDYNEFTYS